MSNEKSQVEIRFLSTFFGLTKKEKLKLTVPEGADLNYVVDQIADQVNYQVAAHIRDHLDYVVLAVNNVDCKQLQGLKTKIKNGDRIVVGHVIAGG